MWDQVLQDTFRFETVLARSNLPSQASTPAFGAQPEPPATRTFATLPKADVIVKIAFTDKSPFDVEIYSIHTKARTLESASAYLVHAKD